MLYKKYCFVGHCYVGWIELDDENDIYKMHWENEDNYTEGARNYKKYMKLDTPKKIKDWMGERIIDRRRPDASIWLTLKGLNPHMTDMQLFIGTHGVSGNDSFWFGDTKDNQFWFNELIF